MSVRDISILYGWLKTCFDANIPRVLSIPVKDRYGITFTSNYEWSSILRIWKKIYKVLSQMYKLFLRIGMMINT